MFFVSWELWEKMSFILGLAILAVFCVGYGKLLWTNRLVKRQEIVDEEKRTRIQELRSSGQIIESRKSHDIPFGVRAIQSGIQVDGIWISNTSTPVPSELKFEHINSHSDTTDSSARASAETPQLSTRPTSRQGRAMFRTSDSTNLSLERATEDAAERQDAAGNRQSYKPRKSSHLRYGSYGDTKFDEETLGQLEGSITPKKKIHTHRPRGSRQVDLEADSSAADNEHSSGTSSDSDATLSSKRLHGDQQPTVPGTSQSIYRERTPVLANVPSGRPARESFPHQSSKADYFAVPHESPRNESLDPFLTPEGSLTPLGSPLAQEESRTSLFQNVRVTGSSSRMDNSQPIYTSLDKSPPPFVPGELHVNKSVRKVNSGFEVLPAGTFGVPAELRSNDTDFEDDSGERRQSKLQKKGRNSMTSRRASSALDHP
ncbi:hypothetical protein G7Y89_g5714 [Cudoniella acicularis]|uniref:Uncharacterized protein n=1 Tax=Cudoniella acicularis TaxID=354080 RepID=A0A8H4RQ75_9HELO|nr:hypothetical protein G7Y89_g5714 [Cudoniella acicularis]